MPAVRLLALSVMVSACTQSAEVVFDVHTDLVAGASFDAIEVTSVHGEHREPALARDYREGVRLESLLVPPGEVTFHVAATRDGRDVLSRDIRLNLTGRAVVPVWLLVVCRDIRCPQAGDAPDATQCEGGRCVAVDCSEARPDLCPDDACTVDDDCRDILSPCGEVRCRDALCVFTPRASGCGATEICDPTMGCVRMLGGDAGAIDGGRDAPGLDVPGLDAPGLDAPGLDAPELDAPLGMDTPDTSTPDGGRDVGPPPDTGCPPGFDDCDGMAGCETNLSSVTSCGAFCAVLVNCTGLPNVAMTRCFASACMILSCAPGFGDCDGDSSNGCEVNLNATATCGSACGALTNCDLLANVSVARCSAGSCGITTCDAGFGNCDGVVANGCEVNLNAPSSCGPSCAAPVDCNALPNVSTGTCSAGSCGITTCDAGFGNCDGIVANGCEVNLNAVASCGSSCAARVDCNGLPNVGAGTCSAGSCGITTCDAGFGNCDGIVANGCEVNLNATATCGSSCATRTNCAALPGVASASCSAGSCNILACSMGFADCDGNPANGCEVNLSAPATCGASCGSLTNCTALPNVATTACSAGACVISTCSPGFLNCDGMVATGCEINGRAPATCGRTCGALTNCDALPNVQTSFCVSGLSCDIDTCDAAWCNTDGIIANGCESPAPC